jgi:hypothetical protein
MIPIRAASISGWRPANRKAAKASGTVSTGEPGLAAAPRAVPRAAHISISRVATPAACRAWA